MMREGQEIVGVGALSPNPILSPYFYFYFNFFGHAFPGRLSEKVTFDDCSSVDSIHTE